MQADRTAAHGADEEEDPDDALPDWVGAFSKLAKSSKDDPVLVPFIPRRGEKDFEPLQTPSSLPASSKEATLSQHQINMLNQSRTALFSALSTGSRHHSSRSPNSFTWRPELDGGRATCDGPSSYGIHFLNMGRHHLERKQMELLPEEALYMVERGVIELWREGEATEDGFARVPMSVQQAWSEIIGHDELTVERFQVYAYLKRLGYVLTRARGTPGTAEVVKKRTIKETFLHLLSLPYTTLRKLVFTLGRSLRSLYSRTPNRIQLTVTRVLKKSEGRITSMISGGRWTSYDQIFSRLQIIPTGHDAPLYRGPAPRIPSVLAPLHPTPATEASPLPKLIEHPYQTFFHVYKPVTKYRKTAPPPPDFRLVIVNAATTSLPDLFEFSSMFSSVPFTEGEDTLLPPPRAIRVGLPPPPPRAPRPGFKPRAPPPPPSRWQKLLSYTPFGKQGAPPRKPWPYQRLKMGRRSILVAVVDNGTISILRFSEAEFGKLPWGNVPGRSM